MTKGSKSKVDPPNDGEWALRGRITQQGRRHGVGGGRWDLLWASAVRGGEVMTQGAGETPNCTLVSMESGGDCSRRTRAERRRRTSFPTTTTPLVSTWTARRTVVGEDGIWRWPVAASGWPAAGGTTNSRGRDWAVAVWTGLRWRRSARTWACQRRRCRRALARGRSRAGRAWSCPGGRCL